MAERFGCGCTYKVGAILILLVLLVINAVSLVMVCLRMTAHKHLEASTTPTTPTPANGTALNDANVPQHAPKDFWTFFHHQALSITQLVWTIISLVHNFLLAIGISLNKRDVVRRWLLGHAFLVVVGSLLYGAGMAMAFVYGLAKIAYMCAIIITAAVVMLSINMFSTYVVYHYWKSMKPTGSS